MKYPAKYFLVLVLPWFLFAATISVGAQVRGVIEEVYDGVANASLASLTNASIFPDHPTRSNLITGVLEAPSNLGSNYGQRMRGYVCAPQTGWYTFWIASDDQGVLFLSPDEYPAHKRSVANVNGWTNAREWSKEANQQSAPVYLETGRRYYLEALQSQGGGGDNLAVGWKLPDGTEDLPISGQYLMPNGPAITAPMIVQQPASLTVTEGTSATWVVGVENLDPVRYQWQRNQRDIAGATNSNYSISRVTSQDQNATFRCWVSNALGKVYSSNATLSIVMDLTPPAITSVKNVGGTQVLITFSEPIAATSATNLANYTFNPEVHVVKATLQADQQTVLLETSPLTYGETYTLIVNGIRDLAFAANQIAANTQASLVAYEYTPASIGAPGQTSAVTVVSHGINVVAGGADIGGAVDQFQFNYQQRTGDFDLMVKLQNLSGADAFAKAGLMARESLEANGRFAATLASPNLNGTFFASRLAVNATATNSGSYPVNYPNTWLRLRRAGALFSGYASDDGLAWVSLGSISLQLSNTIYFGLAVCSHSTHLSATAEFRDLGSTTNARVVVPKSIPDSTGPANRRSGLVISEIMYHPRSRADKRNLEFVEIFNTNPFYEDISGYSLAGDVQYTFPSGTVLQAGQYLVIGSAPEDVAAVYGIQGVYGPYAHKLSGNGGTVILKNSRGGILFKVEYESQAPWPVTPDGSGHSLVLTSPSYGEQSPRAWSASATVGGTPGNIESARPSSLNQIVINELLADGLAPNSGYVELFNPGSEPVDLGGCQLSSSASAVSFVIPPGTVLAPQSYMEFTETPMGFHPNAVGDTIYLWNPDQSAVIDAARFGPQEKGVAWGRFPNGSREFYRLTAPSPGAANSGILGSDLGINEIMYHPISGDDNRQFVELLNHSLQAIDLSQWRLEGGIAFTFPSGTVIPAGGYAVVGKNKAQLLALYPRLNAAITFGDFKGRLSHSGERITLAKPVAIDLERNSGALSGQVYYAPVDEVTYISGGRWGQWSDGGGSSLELMDPRSNKRLPSNWADSDETGKAPWTTLEFTGKLDFGNTAYPPNVLHLLLLDRGECLVDQVEAMMVGKTNLVINGGFELNPTNWVAQGNHDFSEVEAGVGYQGGKALHIRASGTGDTGANRIRAKLAGTLVNGGTGTLRAQARWLKGSPELLLRLWGNYLECAGRMTVPDDLGTPGARNSRTVSHGPPAITEVAHWPPVPVVNQPVLITARVQSPEAIGSVILYYRLDPSGNYTAIRMTDDGTGADATAGDGLYSASIPGRAANTLVAFYIEATDLAPEAATGKFPAEAPVRECLARFGDLSAPAGMGAYHLWMTQATLNRWRRREAMSNEPLDCTFVYGNSRVIYNIGGLYSGSPWHSPSYSSPASGNCDYELVFPEDDSFLGATSISLLQPGNGGGDNTAQEEQTAFWIAAQLGVPDAYHRYVNLYVNGQRRGTVYLDAQRPGPDYDEEWFPDGPNGDLHKVATWYEFNDAATVFSNAQGASLSEYLSGGVKKLARYRWNFARRAVRDSANNYTNLFALVDAMNTNTTGTNYATQIQSMLEVEEWARVLLAEKLVGNSDSYGNGGGQNMYLYKPDDSSWRLLIWDIDFAFSALPASSDIQSFSDPPLARIFQYPSFKRIYWQAVQDAWRGPLQASRVNPLLDAKYAALKANGIAVASPVAIQKYIGQRQTSVGTILSRYNVPFKITSNSGQDFSTNSSWGVLTGAAPFDIQNISVNGILYQPGWTTVTNWTLRIPLAPGINTLTITGLDRSGQAISNAVASIQITNTETQPLSPPVFTQISHDTSDRVTLRWLRLSSASDRIQYKNRLSDTSWQELGASFVIHGDYWEATDYAPHSGERYYRIVRQ